MRLAEQPGPLAYLWRQQELTTRVRDDMVSGHVAGPLIGDREDPDLLDGVAEEVDADRVLLGRAEQVDDAATYGELTTVLDEVDPDVRGVDEVVRQIHGVVVLAGPHGDRPHVAEALDLRLQQRPYGRHDHLRPRGFVGADNASQDGEPPTHRVGARAQPLVREGLPGGVVGDRVGAEHRGDLSGQLLGFAVRAGDQQDRTFRVLGEDRSEQRPQRRRRRHVKNRQ